MSQMSIPNVRMVQPETVRTNAQQNMYQSLGDVGEQAVKSAGAIGVSALQNSEFNKAKNLVLGQVTDDLKQKGETNPAVFNSAKNYIDMIKDPDQLGQAMKAYSVQSQQYDQYVGNLDPDTKQLALKFVSRPVFGSQTLPNFAESQKLIEQAKQGGVNKSIVQTEAGTDRGAIQNAPTAPAPQLQPTQRGVATTEQAPPVQSDLLGNITPPPSGVIKTQDVSVPPPLGLNMQSAQPMMRTAADQADVSNQTDMSTPPRSVSAVEAEAAGASQPFVLQKKAAETLEEKRNAANQLNENREGRLDQGQQKIDNTKQSETDKLKLKQDALDWMKTYQQGKLDLQGQYNDILARANNVKGSKSKADLEKDRADLIAKLQKIKIDAQNSLSKNILVEDSDKQNIQKSISDVQGMIDNLNAAAAQIKTPYGQQVKSSSQSDPLGIR